MKQISFFPYLKPVASRGEVASLARDGNQQNLLITTPTNRWPRESNWWMNLSLFLTKAPKTFLRKTSKTVWLPLLPTDGPGNPTDEWNPLYRQNPKTFFFLKINQTFWSLVGFRYTILLVNNSTISVDILKSRPSVGSLGPISLGLSLPLLAIQWPSQLMGCDGKGFLDILVSPPAFPCVLHIDCVPSSF